MFTFISAHYVVFQLRGQHVLHLGKLGNEKWRWVMSKPIEGHG